MKILLTCLLVLGLYSACSAGVFHLRARSPAFRLPRVTLLLTLIVATSAATQLVSSLYLPLLQRDYLRFLDGDWWRLFTPLFVQDGRVNGAIFNLVTLLIIGTIAEQLWSGKQILVLFFIGGVAGEVVGFAWQPTGAGNSVANFSLAASIAVACLTRRPQKPALFAALLAMGTDAVLVALNDIHGAAAFAGAVCALLMSRWWRNKVLGRPG